MNNPSARPVAIVTGAGNGIGASFARHFYRQGYCLFLVDISSEQLASFVEQLREETTEGGDGHHSPCIRSYVADLTNRSEVEELAKKLEQLPKVEALVNNAGFGSLAEFTDVEIDRHVAMLTIHVETPTRLARAVLPRMKENKRGSIINVSSLSAFAPCEQSVLYSSSKAYLVVFSEALQEEVRGAGIRVQALCPGFVRTEFHSTNAMREFHNRQIPESLWSTPESVVSCSLSRLHKGKVVVIPGWQSRMLGLLMQMIMIRPFVRVALRRRGQELF